MPALKATGAVASRPPSVARSPILGEHGMPQSLRTRSNFQETAALLAGGKVDHARAEALVFGNRSLAAAMVIDPLLALCSRAEIARACAALAQR